jgi:hypothetical protein
MDRPFLLGKSLQDRSAIADRFQHDLAPSSHIQMAIPDPNIYQNHRLVYYVYCMLMYTATFTQASPHPNITGIYAVYAFYPQLQSSPWLEPV